MKDFRIRKMAPHVAKLPFILYLLNQVILSLTSLMNVLSVSGAFCLNEKMKQIALKKKRNSSGIWNGGTKWRPALLWIILACCSRVLLLE